MSIYFIQNKNTGHVKIGVAKSPKEHLNGLQEAHHEELSIIRVLDGGRSAEKWFHNYFKAFFVRGEWFTFDEKMMTVCPPESFDEPEVRQPAMSSEKFRKIRKGLGLSQEQLGRVLDRERRQIIRYEKGSVPIPAWAELALESLVRRHEGEEADA